MRRSKNTQEEYAEEKDEIKINEHETSQSKKRKQTADLPMTNKIGRGLRSIKLENVRVDSIDENLTPMPEFDLTSGEEPKPWTKSDSTKGGVVVDDAERGEEAKGLEHSQQTIADHPETFKKSGRYAKTFEEIPEKSLSTANQTSPSDQILVDSYATRRKSIEFEDKENINKLYAKHRNSSESTTTLISQALQATDSLPIAATIEIEKKTKIFDLLSIYEVALTEMGYQQLVHKPVLDNDPILQLPNVAPTNEAKNEVNGVATLKDAVGHHMSGRLSARLYAKEGMFYVLLLRSLFTILEAEINNARIKKTLAEPTVFKAYPNGACTVLVVLVRNQDGILEQQLRIIPGTTTGHPGLVFRNEGAKPPCLLAAGEAYFLNGKIILINNKSGAFHAFLASKQIDQGAIFDSMLKDYYDPTYKDNCYVLASTDDQAMIYEVLGRGFPYSLLSPPSVREKFPIENLQPIEFREKVIAIDVAFQQTQTQTVSQKVEETAHVVTNDSLGQHPIYTGTKFTSKEVQQLENRSNLDSKSNRFLN